MQTSDDVRSRSKRASWAVPGSVLTLTLHATILTVMGYSVATLSDLGNLSLFTIAAILPLLLAVFLVIVSAPSLVAHCLSLATGAAYVLGAVMWTVRAENASWSATFQSVRTTTSDVWSRIVYRDELLNEQALMLSLGLVWIVGWSSAWLLYQRKWLGASLSMPAAVVLAGLFVDRSAPTWPALLFMAAAMVMAARFNAYRRFSVWREQGYDVPKAPASRFAVAGVFIALFSLLVATAATTDAVERNAEAVAIKASEAIDQASDRITRFSREETNVKAPPAGFASFDSSFAIDGNISLSNEPAVLLRAPQSMYLAGRRLDTYDGATWTSSASDMPQVAGVDDSAKLILVTFGPEQPMNLSESQQSDRVQQTVEIEPIGDPGGVVLTVDTHYAASIATSVSMRWELYEETIAIGTAELATMPIELQPMLRMLQIASFTDDGSGVPVIDDPDIADAFVLEQARLIRDYPLSTSLIWTDDGPALSVMGRLPVYDDVQAVFSRTVMAGAPYRVSGLASVAQNETLAAATEQTSIVVADNALELPASVTDRTRELAVSIAGDASTAFDAGLLVQDYLRQIPYNLNVESPPDGQDSVDFFLFDRPEGRCTNFASAMVVMMRSLGYPSRIVAGFAPGAFSNEFDGFVSRYSDAHTWVEVLVPGYGWIPFEPTPSEPALDYSGTALEAEPTPEPELIDPTPQPTTVAAAEPDPSPSPVAVASTDAGGTSAPDPILAVPLFTLALIALGLIGGLVIWRRGVLGLDPASAAFAKARRLGRLWGVPESTVTTPTEYGKTFASMVPASERPIERIVTAYSKRQYGPDSIAVDAEQSPDDAWSELRVVVKKWRPWGR